MKRLIYLAIVGTLISLLTMSCDKSGKELPKANSRNDYQYTYTITATEGDVHIRFTGETDGEMVKLNGEESERGTPIFMVKVEQGATKRYILTTKGAIKFSIKATIMSGGVKGKLTFEEHRNGKSIRKDAQTIEVGLNETRDITYHSTTAVK